jgi:putative flippase GtrA/GT2 family glycosyltransferase
MRPPRQRATRGKHAAPKTSYLSTRGARFVLFSAIGGAVFLMGLAIQYVLTGRLHLPSMWSYMVQAVVSVEVNFLLNQWLTWRDRAVPFWTAFIRFNAQRTVTVTLNSLLYFGLIRLGMNYLMANVVLTAAFTVVNYLVGDLFVFTPRRTKVAAKSTFDPSETLPLPRAPRPPDICVVIPCRNNQATIKATVLSLLGQNYPGLRQLTLIGSPGDSTWAALADIADPRLEMLELATPPGVRDANFKRDYGIRRAASDLVALVDSDVVLPSDWMSRAVHALDESRASCVTGGMRSVRDDFWGRYTDHTVVGAKTPRVARSYAVTRENFGVGGRKPPITANILFKREFYDECPIDPYWSHGSYEDYEWFWRVVKAGHHVRVCWELFGWHHHRQGMSALIKEYRRSSRGCAYFIRAHVDSPLARRRLMQAVALPLLAVVAVVGLGVGVVAGYAATEVEVALAGAVLVAGLQVVRSRRIEGIAYAATGITLGLVFTTGLVTNLLRASTGAPDRATLPEGTTPVPPRGPLRYLVHPLTLICALQAALSLTLIWSNTAFTDEADYLWIGRLRLANLLHGAGWPSTTGQHVLPGSADIYPPIGAIVNAIGGLAGARIASLAFMLGATVLLYFMAQRLFDATVASFAIGLWAVSEPTLRLAFATADPLSVLLTALAGWLVVQAGHRRRHGELVAAAGATLALATATSYSACVIVPVVIGFAFFAWLPRLGVRQAGYSAGWLTAAFALFLGLLLTVSGSWSGFGYTAFGRYITTRQGATQVLNDLWNYTGLIVVLAVAGAIIAVSAERTQRSALIGLLGCASLTVPAVQFLTGTTDLADRRLAYGMLFGVMAAGYGCAKVVRWLPSATRQFTLACCAVALVYPATAAWQSAWDVYHGWPDASQLIASFAPAAARTQGYLYAAGQTHVVEYYTPQIAESARWSTGQLPLDPPATAPTAAYYARQLKNADYGLIALFYSTSFTSANLPPSLLTSPQASRVSTEVLGLVGVNSGEPGLLALTQALEHDKAYRLLRVGPYDSAHQHGVFAIWQRVTP